MKIFKLSGVSSTLCVNDLSGQLAFTALGKIHFCTATIHQWYHLLADDCNKELILAYLKKLSEGLATIYAFVPIAIGMPNHIHMVWQQNKLNGKETLKGTLLKYTAHTFPKQIKLEGKADLCKVASPTKATRYAKRFVGN